MNIVVLGNTHELIVFADLMQKSGGSVRMIVSPQPDHLTLITPTVDVVALSSEIMIDELFADILRTCRRTKTLVCDITDGSDPLSADRPPLPEHLLQAATGLAQITGLPNTPPTISKVPFIAVSSALYAASFVLAMRRVDPSDRYDQTVKVSRTLTALNALTTFLPAALQGQTLAPIGNSHPSSSPWNTYPTKDGSVLICTSKDTQWRKLRDVIGTDAAHDPKYDAHGDRIADRGTLDVIIGEWTNTQTSSNCVQVLLDAGIPAGPILAIDKVLDDPNMQARQGKLPQSQQKSFDPGERIKGVSLFRISPLGAQPRPDAPAPRRKVSVGKPLAGLRVIEMGQFTTAPLACRHLVGLGADVLKVESPGGEASRQWKPIIDGVGHFFTITNTGKRFVQLNLRDPDQLEQLKDEIKTADLIVENMRPDVMGKLGLGHKELAALNPDLTVCSISGFGAHGAYPGRAAYDTIIQGISGIMDLTRSAGLPVKLGISAADILGAQVALFAILSHLDQRGQFIDISMQDVAAYAALLGLHSPLTTQDITSAITNVRSVEEIAQSKPIAREMLSQIADPNGALRLAPKLPYSLC